MDASISVAHPRLGNFLDPLDEGRLSGPLGTVVIGRSIDRQSPAGPPEADLLGRAHVIDHLPLPGRRHILRRMTSSNIALGDRSITIRFSRWFSSSSCLSRFISDGSSPPYFVCQL